MISGTKTVIVHDYFDFLTSQPDTLWCPVVCVCSVSQCLATGILARLQPTAREEQWFAEEAKDVSAGGRAHSSFTLQKMKGSFGHVHQC